MKAYSNDLRIRIVQAHKAGSGSMRDLALEFGVSSYFVNDMVQKFRKTGNIEPKRYKPGPQPKIREEMYPSLKAIVINDRDRTLKEYCDMFFQETDIRVSTSKMCKILNKLKLTRKKRSSRIRTRHSKSTTAAS